MYPGSPVTVTSMGVHAIHTIQQGQRKIEGQGGLSFFIPQPLYLPGFAYSFYKAFESCFL